MLQNYQLEISNLTYNLGMCNNFHPQFDDEIKYLYSFMLPSTATLSDYCMSLFVYFILSTSFLTIERPPKKAYVVYWGVCL